MKYIYLAIFIVFTTIHLYASWHNSKHLRNFSKGYILLSLLGFYVSMVDEPSWIVIFAILASWLGDLFLIPHGIKWFSIGGAAFAISHILFIVAYSEDIVFSSVPVYAIILLAIAFITAVVLIFTKLKNYLSTALLIPMFIYLLINGTMNCFAIYRFISNLSLPTLITMVGAILFFASDTTLFFVRFNKESRLKSHFVVMLTYSLGEFLIILGLALVL